MTMEISKVCNTCGMELPIMDFPRNGVDKEGKPRRRADCNTCYTVRRKLNKKKITKFVNNTKHRTGEEQTYKFEDWKDVMLYFGGTCCYCGRLQSRKVRLTKDHVKPVKPSDNMAVSGTTTRRNIVPACAGCNSSKGNDDMEKWFRKQVFFSEKRLEKIKRWCTYGSI